LDALKEIVNGRAADPQTMQKLVTCDFVEEFDGTALLTARGIKAAASLSSTDAASDASDLASLMFKP
jgi:hypothetical protein